MVGNESRSPGRDEIGKIVHSEIKTHQIAPVEYEGFLLGKLALGEQRNLETIVEEAQTELNALYEQYPYLRQEDN